MVRRRAAESSPQRGPLERELRRLLAAVEPGASAGERAELASRSLLGRPYVTNPLRGSPDTDEVFTASLAGFDCVTYVETVLALALARTAAGFCETLRRLRYERGVVEWRSRNHYMTGWLRNNVRARLVRRVVLPAPSVVRERVLQVVPGLATRRVRLRCVPKRRLAGAGRALRSGDVLLFASTRRDLDVFHVGLVVRADEGLRLRHAARSRGGVVEQPLDEFLAANSMAGVIAARVVERRTPGGLS